MKRNNFVLCLFCLVAMISFSHVALGQTVTFSNTHIETNAKTSDGKSALKVHYDANVKGCYGHTIKIGLSITAGNGTHIVDSDENKGVGFTTQEIHYDNSNLSDRSIIVPYSKFKVYSGKNTYYYQLYAVDKVTGDYLGESYLTAFDMVGNSNSGNKTNKSTQSASFSDLRLCRITEKGQEWIKYYYDVNLKGCRGRTVDVHMSFLDSNGNYKYGKDGKKLYWTKTFKNIDSDNINYTDQTFLISLKEINNPDGEWYYLQYSAFDKTTGNLLGKSNSEGQYFGSNAKITQERIYTGKGDDGLPSYQAAFHVDYILPRADDMDFYLAVFTDIKCEQPHLDKNGDQVSHHYHWKNPNNMQRGGIRADIGIEFKDFNALPGTNNYYMFIYIGNSRTGELIGMSGPWKFAATGDGSYVKPANAPSSSSSSSSSSKSTKDDSYKFIEDFDSLEEYERYMEDLERQYMEKRKARVKDNTK